MRLSEAIKEGAKLGPQGFGDYVTADGKYCAMGGARAYCDNSAIPMPVVDSIADCPACGKFRIWVANIVVHLNDEHRWTRERIAHWVATVEPAEAA